MERGLEWVRTRSLCEEAMSFLRAGKVPSWLIGSCGLAWYCDPGLVERSGRRFKDIDLLVKRKSVPLACQRLVEHGFKVADGVRIASEDRRVAAVDSRTGCQIDLLTESFEFNQAFEFVRSWSPTRDVAEKSELWLSKLQRVGWREVDSVDACLMLIADDPWQGDSREAFLEVAVSTWGWTRTVLGNLHRVVGYAPTASWLGSSEKEAIMRQITEVDAEIAARPKSIVWRMRAALGERVAWYTPVDEDIEAFQSSS